jgi:hypothetical protein
LKNKEPLPADEQLLAQLQSSETHSTEKEEQKTMEKSDETSKAKKNKNKKVKQKESKPLIERSLFLEEMIKKMFNKEKIDYRIVRGHVHECAVD